MQRVFSSATRRETLGKHLKGDRRGGELKTLSALCLERHRRHTCAFHLLQSGVDIAVIASWLGHENIQTTHGYIEADLLIKEQALQKLAPAGQATTRFKPDDALLRFLTSL
jgi:integrase